jgi:hypothetical protein
VRPAARRDPLEALAVLVVVLAGVKGEPESVLLQAPGDGPADSAVRSRDERHALHVG